MTAGQANRKRKRASAHPCLGICGLPLLAAVAAGGGEPSRQAALPPDANALCRFLADLNANHTMLYALLGLVSVAALALVLSLVTERLLHVLGYRNRPASK